MMKMFDFSRPRGTRERRIPARTARRVLWLACVCMWCVLPLAMQAQDLDARSPQPMPVGKQQRKAEKKKAKQQAELNKAIRKGKKQHEKLQSKQTKKMMKKSRKKSKRWNDNRREFFLKRWFSPRHRKADAGDSDFEQYACSGVVDYTGRRLRSVVNGFVPHQDLAWV